MRNIVLTAAFVFLVSCQRKPESVSFEPISNETISLLEENPPTEIAEEDKKEPILLPDGLAALVPDDFAVTEVVSGDLNKDSREDYVLIIKDTDKENIAQNRFEEVADRNRRGIIIAFKEGNGYKKVVENRSCFSSENEDGGVYFPPELSVHINKNNNLEINYGHGRYGHWGYMFRYQNKAFELIGYHASENRGPVELSKVSINFSTKKKKISVNTNPEGDSGEEVWEEKWEDSEIDELVNLQDIEDFDYLEL